VSKEGDGLEMDSADDEVAFDVDGLPFDIVDSVVDGVYHTS
jgi:hypothetical protein